MSNVKQLKENNANIFPVTHEDVVLDNNGKSIGKKLKEHIDNHPNGEFNTDWGTAISTGVDKIEPNVNGFPSGFSDRFIHYSTKNWLCFKNGESVPRIRLNNGLFACNDKVTYMYSTTNGERWNTYTDNIMLPCSNISEIIQSTEDIYNSAFTDIDRPKDDIGGEIDKSTLIEVSMVNADSNTLREYVGVKAQIVVDTTNQELRLMDGVTKGGKVIGANTGGSGGEFVEHTHTKSEITDFNHTHNKTEITDFEHIHSEYLTSLPSHRHDASQIDNLPNGGSGGWIGSKSVKDFGARGDGTTDDTNAIQQALDWSNTNAKTVYFPSGKYKVTQTLLLGDYCSLKGDNGLVYGKDQYGPGNVNDCVIQCLALTVFKKRNGSENTLNSVDLSFRNMNFQQGDPTDSNMLNSIFFYKIQLCRTSITDCLFRGFGIWLMGSIFMLGNVENNIFMEMRKYFIQSLSIPGIGNQAGLVDARIRNNYISGSQCGTVDNIAFFINYPAFTEISGNFIDFWKWGTDIWQGESFSLTSNDFQYCAKGIRIGGASAFNLEGNRFGKMKYSEHKSGFRNDVSRWGTTWCGIDLESDLSNLVVTNNIGSTIDTLIRARASTYSRLYINANMSTGVIIDTSIANDSTNKVFIQEFR